MELGGKSLKTKIAHGVKPPHEIILNILQKFYISINSLGIVYKLSYDKKWTLSPICYDFVYFYKKNSK